MMHDMAITEDFAILLDVPLVFRPEVMVTKNRLPLVYDKSRPARFGIIPKRPKSGKEVRWFDLDPGEQHAATSCHRTRRPFSCPAFTPLSGRAWHASLPSSGHSLSGPRAPEVALLHEQPSCSLEGEQHDFKLLCMGLHVQP